MNIILVHNDNIEQQAKQYILSFYKKLPLFIKDITLNSQEKWSTSSPTKIILGLVWNQTREDLMCLWIHEQLHRWEKTRDPKWIEYVKQNYTNRDMDDQMNQFTNDIDSCFAQHLVVIWNAFNITKKFYPNYIKKDVAYVILQKFIRDNWDRIQQDLRKFNLVIEPKKKELQGGQQISSTINQQESKSKSESKSSSQKDNNKQQPNPNSSSSQKYVCKCAFSRNKGVKDYTCLVDNEIRLLWDIVKLPANNLQDFYKKLIDNYNCGNSQKGVDQCVKSNLISQYGSSVENMFINALPLQNQIQTMTQWLSSSNIDLLSKQLENNYPHFKYMGICTWDMFEDSIKDEKLQLNPQFIIKTIYENPTKKVFGWILNQCHKFSTGTHWVALGLIKENEKQFKWLYYDSQDKAGPQLGIIYCDFRQGLELTQQQLSYYQNYKSKFPQWWESIKQQFKDKGLDMNQTIHHNTFITQKDSFRCGYHAFYFLYLITTQGTKTIDALNLQIMSTQSDSLDKFMADFQKKVFDLGNL